MTALPALPEGMRILSPEDLRAVHDAVRQTARRHGIGSVAADEISYDALAAVGLFVPPPSVDDSTCTALYLPHQREQFDADMLGVWQQCADDPGHDGTDHDSGDIGWSDGNPGALPAS